MKTKLLFVVVAMLSFLAVATATTYYSTGNADPTNISNWNAARDGSGASPADFITTGDVFIIQGTGGQSGAPHSMTAASVWGVGSLSNGVSLTVESGATLQANANVTISASSSFTMDNSATYIHNHTSAYASGILNGTENFDTGSNFIITNSATTGPGTPTGGFGNLTLNNTTNTSNVNSAGALTNIKGNFTVIATGTGTVEFRLTGATLLTLNIGGNLNIQGGVLDLGNGTASPVVNLAGNFSMSGGTLNYIATGGTALVPVVATVNFSKTGVQTFTKSAGTITAASSSFRHISFVVLSGSTMDMGTSILNCAGSTNCDFTVNSGGTVRLGDPGGVVAQGTSATTGNIQTSSTSVRNFGVGGNYEYTGSAAQITGTGLPASVNDLTINNAAGVTLTNSLQVNGTLAITSGSLILSTAAAPLVSNVTYGPAGTLLYNGSSAQATSDAEFPAAAGPFNLTINNAAGVSLHANRSIAGTLALSSGNLDLNGSFFTYGSIDGTSGTLSQTVSLNAPSAVDVGGLGAVITSSADLGSTTVKRGVSPQGGSSPGIKRWYDVTPTNNSGLNATLMFRYDESELNGIVEANLRLFKSTNGGTTWTIQAAALDETANTLTLSGIDGFSRWTAADVDSPLPIQLASFTATVINAHTVRLNWTTLSEVNNYGFYVQRKLVSETRWTEIPNSFMPGHGTTNEPQHYSFTDNNATTGRWQYRLRQIDLDGAVHFSEPTQVDVLADVREVAPMQFVLHQNYPNPFNPETEIKFSVEITSRATLEVYNIVGQRVATLYDDVAQAGEYYRVKFRGLNLASGVYYYRLLSGAKSDLKKLMLLK